ncbi:MAG TPA: hypothetical protein VM536_07255 [Chloroflexia bacterium]|nr:hypothetical protein [Chloroflexia bacterium]
MKYVRGFIAFWYDFIVGDAWEVAAGVVFGLLVLYAAARYAGSSAPTVGAILLPVLVVALLAYSLWRVRGPST